jgi:hypothetical protein
MFRGTLLIHATLRVKQWVVCFSGLNSWTTWDLSTIQAHNAANEMSRNDKYEYVDIYEAEKDEIRRIMNCE